MFARLFASRAFADSVLNFMGLAAPLLLGAYAVPLLVAKLGVVRFGHLTLVWAVAGYFSFLDFGLSRALTKRVAQLNDPRTIGAAIRTGLSLLLGFGVLAAIVILAVYHFATARGLMAATLEYDRATLYLAFGMPFLLLGLGLRGILEGRQRFSASNWSRLVLGGVTFGAPIPLLKYSPTLDILVAALTLGRIVIVFIQGSACWTELGWARAAKGQGEARGLLAFGGWMMVSNLVSPLMVFMDRFFVGGSPVANRLAFYTTPFEAVTRVLIVPGAIVTTLFPRMASAQRRDRVSAEQMMLRGMGITLALLAPIVLGLQLFAAEILNAWLGLEFARESATPMRLIAWGVLFNSMAQFPFAYLQSIGRPSWIAKLHLAELPVYVLFLAVLLKYYGIVGVAVAWLGRVAVDMAFLEYMACFASDSPIGRRLAGISAVTLAIGMIGAAGFALDSIGMRFAVFASACAVLVAYLGTTLKREPP